MIEQQLDIDAPDGQMNTFITHPEEGGPFPVVLFLMDAMGRREELYDMARRIATAGYFVLLPNLYYRRVREYVPDWTDEEKEMEIMFGHMNSLSNDMVVSDCRALLEYANHQALAKDGAVGAIGYSMSGPFVFAAAAQISDRIKAAASVFGFRLCTDAPDSPHLFADKIEGEIYFAFAEIDEYITQEELDSLIAHLKTTDINYRIEVYPGAIHGFTYPLEEEYYHKPSAERHWERIHAILKRAL